MNESIEPSERHLALDDPRRVVRYVRTAAKVPKGHNTAEAQMGRIDAFLLAQGLEATCDVFDVGASGISSDPPGIAEIVRLAQDGLATTVVASSPNRFSRDPLAQREVLSRLQHAGVTVYVADGERM